MQSVDPAMFVREPACHRTCDITGKRTYTSTRQARAAHRGANFRIRTYICEFCNRLHVTNEDKYK